MNSWIAKDDPFRIKNKNGCKTADCVLNLLSFLLADFIDIQYDVVRILIDTFLFFIIILQSRSCRLKCLQYIQTASVFIHFCDRIIERKYRNGTIKNIYIYILFRFL